MFYVSFFVNPTSCFLPKKQARPTLVFQEVKQEKEDKYAHSPGTKTAETKLLQKKENLSKSPYIFVLPT